ncbi:MAG: two-component system KDP operon response regulator KdpE [Cellvibrionaceae bacterium]|jgi:two-component system KDP operon response regulator KdpE
MKPKILVVDDEKTIREFISKNLAIRDFDVLTAGTGLEALALFGSQSPDLIILDIMMPSMDGLETCRRIRQQSHVPIIVLTALGEESDRVMALDVGADDVLTKPFGVEELMARVRAALRRMDWMEKSENRELLSWKEITLDPDAISVTARSAIISLTQTEYRLLHYFMQNTGKTLPHHLILKEIWGPEYGNEAEYLRVYIGRLRRKIEINPSKPEYLHTEFGMGYRFGG